MVVVSWPNVKSVDLNIDPKTTSLKTLKLEIQRKLADIPPVFQSISCSGRTFIGVPQTILIAELGVKRNSTLTLETILFEFAPRGSILRLVEYSVQRRRSRLTRSKGRKAAMVEKAPHNDDEDSKRPPYSSLSQSKDDEAAVVEEAAHNDDEDSEYLHSRLTNSNSNEVAVVEKAAQNDDEDNKHASNGIAVIDQSAHNDQKDNNPALLTDDQVASWTESRRKSMREARLKQDLDNNCAPNPNFQRQFADLRGDLHAISPQEWEDIPETEDSSLRTKNKRKLQTDQTPAVDKGQIFSQMLDSLPSSITSTTAVDPKSYLNELDGIRIASAAKVSEIRKGMLIIEAYVSKNPKNRYGWIVGARLEEEAGRIEAARQLIMKGCQECPRSEEIWLEACRLSSNDEVKAVIVEGLKRVPNSVKLWMLAADLERDDASKIWVLTKGLEEVPNSVRLRQAVEDLAGIE
ncbi:hypothetical protein RJ639_005033 [Escallonia herrerae]|uniref:PRP1 splicing factor N-terminal domain-containing protein n=1 Tax=Escallonia herrerae TaxID=1293975 RepID=A0AA88W4E3_9ASTE|nr:hypothetical protein RJ639_005033 [Escallonia herrerae]